MPSGHSEKPSQDGLSGLNNKPLVYPYLRPNMEPQGQITACPGTLNYSQPQPPIRMCKTKAKEVMMMSTSGFKLKGPSPDVVPFSSAVPLLPTLPHSTYAWSETRSKVAPTKQQMRLEDAAISCFRSWGFNARDEIGNT